jgi:Brp/Blh family beta-carotene 15,15'-monooxygenase
MSTWLLKLQRRHTLFVVFLLAFALLASPFTPSLPLSLQLTILATAVVIFGLPHGALDLALVQGACRGTWHAPAAAIAVYVAVAAVVLALWLAAPVTALIGFLAIAVIHFGLGDTEDLNGTQRAVEVVARGGFAGIAPLVFHPQTTRELFALLVGPDSTASLNNTLAIITAPAALLWGSCLVMAVVGRFVQRQRGWLPATAELLLTCAIFAVLHPLAAFVLYFCFVHSIRHIADLGAARFPDSAARARIWLLLESLPFTIATIILGATAWFLFGQPSNFDEAMMRIVFWGLSALTMPHMILTTWWHGRGDPQPGDLFSSLRKNKPRQCKDA